MARSNTEQFISKARTIHGDKYDYSKVVYTGVLDPVCIICPEHGEFLQKPREHLSGNGCPRCGGVHKYTTEEFITICQQIHQKADGTPKYDYAKVEYVNAKTKVCIICPTHGEFWQEPHVHMFQKSGCPTCAGKPHYDTASFIERARSVHGNKYDYSKVDYQSGRKKVIIGCPEHGDFLQAPFNHIIGKSGCPECAKLVTREKRLKPIDDFIKQARLVHGDIYDYSKVEYTGNRTKVCIVCKKHGVFWQDPTTHLGGHGCPECGMEKVRISLTKPQEQFLKEAHKVHGDKYDYSKVEYVNGSTKVCIICPQHGDFWQTPYGHLKGYGCRRCANENLSSMLTFEQEEFIERARAVHGDKYNYSKADYKGTHIKVCIECPKHGGFWKDPYSHIIRHSGCPECHFEETGRKYRLTTTDFIKKARSVHGEKYDYSKTEYTKSDEKVCIICPKHGEFWQAAASHLSGNGCPLCAIDMLSLRPSQKGIPKKKRITTEMYIDKAKEVHGNKYDYSKTQYTGRNQNVCIICPEHGEFWQNAGNHLQGSICPKCAGSYSPTTEEYVEKVKRIHQNKYDYSKVVYTKGRDKICIICPEHGEFWQSAAGHLNGQGCPKCSPNRKLDTNSFIAEARIVHGDEYDYSLVDYVDALTPVKVICQKHGIFEIIPTWHLQGGRCKKCSRRYMDTDFFIEVAREKFGDKYDYSKTVYAGAFDNVTIICPIHGEFQQVASRHLSGNGCPQCNESHLELDIRKLLKYHRIKFTSQKSFPWLVDTGRLRLDFYLQDYNIAIECQGEQHFEALEFFGGEKSYEETTRRDKIKSDLCKEHGITILYYSDLGIDYPYEVFENKNALIRKIQEIGPADKPMWIPEPELPFGD